MSDKKLPPTMTADKQKQLEKDRRRMDLLIKRAIKNLTEAEKLARSMSR